MLAEAARGLAADGYHLSVLGRRPERLGLPADKAALYRADWYEPGAFVETTRRACDDHGPPDLALVWTHDPPRGLPLELARVIADAGARFRMVHVLGSAVSDPSRHEAVLRARTAFTEIHGCDWRPVFLGFVIENDVSRWLTHDEISDGALRVVRDDLTETVIGVTRPWDARP